MTTDKVISVSEALDETARAAVRCVDEVWRQPGLERDGTKMVMVPEVLFKRLQKAVEDLLETGEY